MQASYFKYSLSAPKLIGKSYFSVIVAGICISVISLIVNLTFSYGTDALFGQISFDPNSALRSDWWKYYITIYFSGMFIDLFHYLFNAVIVFTVWKVVEIKYILPSDMAFGMRKYINNVILLSLIVYVLFVVFNLIYKNYFDLSSLGNLEISDNSFTPWSGIIKSNFINPIFTYLFAISLSAMLIKKLNPFQAIYEIWSFLNLAPIGLILFGYVFIVFSQYVPRELVDLIRTPYYLSQIESGYNTNMAEGIATTLVFNSISGLIFMILFAIPSAAIVHFYNNQYDRSVE